MSTKAVTPDASAASPNSIEAALDSGFLPTDPHYLRTGKFRDASEEKSEPKESAETEEASAASESDADIEAAPAAAQIQEKVESHQKTAKSSESRWAKLSRENRDLRERLARLEGAQSAQEPQRESKPAPQAAEQKPGRPKLDDLDAKTNLPKYKTYAEYEEAKDQWLREETLRSFREESEKTTRERAQAEAERTLAEGMVKKFQSARSKYADFDEVALGEHVLIPKGSVTDAFLLDSDHAGEVAYYLGQHPEITQDFYGDFNPQTGQFVNKITPQRQFRELMAIESEVSGAKKAAPVKPVTQAPRPPHQLSGKSAVAKDAVEQAVDEQDMDTYIREQNSRDRRIASLRNRK
jgi:hypothetical protein